MFKGKIHRYYAKIQYKDLDMYSVTYHPRYFEFADSGRNQAFADFGYSVEEQLKDRVGFTIAGMQEVAFNRPLFMGEEITVFTEVIEVGRKSCKVNHWITLGYDKSDIDKDNKFGAAIFKATYSLVFVSIAQVSLPLNRENIKDMKAIEFSDRVKTQLGF